MEARQQAKHVFQGYDDGGDDCQCIERSVHVHGVVDDDLRTYRGSPGGLQLKRPIVSNSHVSTKAFVPPPELMPRSSQSPAPPPLPLPHTHLPSPTPLVHSGSQFP